MKRTKAVDNVLLFITLLLVILACVYGYQEYQENKGRDEIADKIENSRLFSISPSLAFLVHAGETNETIDCLLANISSDMDKQKNNEKADDTLKNLFKGKNEICIIWTNLNKYNREVSNVALKEGKIKNSGFLFYGYRLSEWLPSTEYSSYHVGLFQNIEDCQNAEKVFLKYDYATKPCRAWNPRGFNMISKWSYLVTFIFFLLIPSLCGAKSELSKTITVCGTSEGYTYTLESPFTASDFLGWNKDTVQPGEIRFVIRDGKPDIILRDVLPRTTSLRKIGGKVEVLSDGSKSGITTVLVVFPDGTIHHYLFQIDKSGNGQVVWGAAAGYGIPPKSFLMRAQCKSE